MKGNWSEVKATPEYQSYHQQVVAACVADMGEQVREFFDKECDYLDEFTEGRSPEDVAQDQRDSL